MGIITPDTIMRPSQPYTAIKKENILEPATSFVGKCPSLAFMGLLTLLKIRLLMDFQSLQRSKAEVSGRLPQELLDEIRKNMVSSTVPKSLIKRDDHAEIIEALVRDVGTLYIRVNSANVHFWPAMLHPVNDLNAEQQGWYYGNKERCRWHYSKRTRLGRKPPGLLTYRRHAGCVKEKV